MGWLLAFGSKRANQSERVGFYLLALGGIRVGRREECRANYARSVRHVGLLRRSGGPAAHRAHAQLNKEDER